MTNLKTRLEILEKKLTSDSSARPYGNDEKNGEIEAQTGQTFHIIL